MEEKSDNCPVQVVCFHYTSFILVKKVLASGERQQGSYSWSDESHRFDHGVNHNTIKRISSATGCPIRLEDVQRPLILRELCMSRYDKNATYVNSKV